MQLASNAEIFQIVGRTEGKLDAYIESQAKCQEDCKGYRKTFNTRITKIENAKARSLGWVDVAKIVLPILAFFTALKGLGLI